MTTALVPVSQVDAVPAALDQVAHVPQGGLEAITRSEIDTQIATARRYPRSLKRFRDTAVGMATLDEETAASCRYVLPRKREDGTFVEGPSIRLAEIVAVSWGNLRFGGSIIEETDRWIVARGIAQDMEANVMASVEVRRRIVGKSGKRYGDDMIGVTGQAAIAIAIRNALFKVIPRVFVDQIYDVAKRAAVGNEKTLGARRQAAFDHFTKTLGIPKDRVFARLSSADRKVTGLEDIGLSDLELLHGLGTAIKDGEITAVEAFAPDPETAQDPPAKSTATGAIGQFVAANQPAAAPVADAQFEPATMPVETSQPVDVAETVKKRK